MKIGDKIWYAKRIQDNNAIESHYNQPIAIQTRLNYLTVMPVIARGYMEVVKYGEELLNTWTGIANARYFSDTFHAGDLIWVDGAKPIPEIEETDGIGASANAIIKSVLPVNNTIHIVIERRKNDEDTNLFK